MKKIGFYLFSIASFIWLTTSRADAQTTDVSPSKLTALSAPIVVDGSISDWGDSLQYYNADNDMRYAITNNDSTLYFAFRVKYRYEVNRVLKYGLTLSLDPKGKKKDAFSITFPIKIQMGNLTEPVVKNDIEPVTQADRDELTKDLATTLRGIKVEGFKDVEYDIITTANTYGIKTGLNYDVAGNLICEVAIPLKFFHADGRSKNQWLFNVKINGFVPPAGQNSGATTSGRGGGGMGGSRGGMGGGGGRGGMGGNRGGSTNTNKPTGETDASATKTIDFSGKFYLAK